MTLLSKIGHNSSWVEIQSFLVFQTPLIHGYSIWAFWIEISLVFFVFFFVQHKFVGNKAALCLQLCRTRSTNLNFQIIIMNIEIILSSAKMYRESSSIGRSFMKIRNKIDLITEPCGMPTFNTLYNDKTSFISF